VDKLAATGGTPVRTTSFPDWPQYDDAERAAVLRVLDSRNWWATEGVEVSAFEAEWAAFTGATGAVAVTNGTHALEVALAGLDIGQGDEVIVPDWSFMATIGAVLAANAIPVIVDVDSYTGTIDLEAAAAAITPRTRALLPVHLSGNMAEMDGLRKLAAEHGLLILEDAAQAHGSTWNGQHAGTLGDAGTFSFQASKNMTAGEGGIVVCQGADVVARVRSLANCGRRPDSWFYKHFDLASNLRMTEWQGAVLRAQLGRFPAQQAVRSANVDFLNAALADLPGITPQGRHDGCTSQGNYDYIVRFDPELFPDRDRVRTALLAEGMPLTTGYPPMHQLEMFTRQGGLGPRLRDTSGYPDYARQSFPVSEDLANTTIWFKTQALMGSREDSQSVLDALAKIHRHAPEIAQLEPAGY
jgi:dTDP-4-amino-4,6-dideoxygalactose transaminase